MRKVSGPHLPQFARLGVAGVGQCQDDWEKEIVTSGGTRLQLLASTLSFRAKHSVISDLSLSHHSLHCTALHDSEAQHCLHCMTVLP